MNIIKYVVRDTASFASTTYPWNGRQTHSDFSCPFRSWNANPLLCCRRFSRIFLRTLSNTSKLRIGLESVRSFFSKSLVRCRILPMSSVSVSSFDPQLIRRNSITSFVQLL